MNSDDKALSSFFASIEEQNRKKNQKAIIEASMIEKKRPMIDGLSRFLDQFIAMGLVVPASDAGDPGVRLDAVKKFEYYQGPSSPTWAPGISIFFDHPAVVEIAVPNDQDISKYGVLVIRSVSAHKDKILLETRINSIDKAKEVLASFLGKNAISIESDPRRKAPDARVMDRMPKEAPKEVDKK